VSTEGGELPVSTSLLRFMPLGLPWFLNGLWLPLSQLESWTGVLVSLVVFGVGGSVIYLAVFNRRTRQSLHDLVAGSYVVAASSSEPPEVEAIWKPHLAICGVLILVAGLTPTLTMKQADSEPFSDLLVLQDRVSSLEWVVHAQSFAGRQTVAALRGTRTTTTYLSITAFLREDEVSNRERADVIADMGLRVFPTVRDKDLLLVNLVYGYDIGIASAWRRQTYSNPPGEWGSIAPAL
jgi:hypothetical protein